MSKVEKRPSSAELGRAVEHLRRAEPRHSLRWWVCSACEADEDTHLIDIFAYGLTREDLGLPPEQSDDPYWYLQARRVALCHTCLLALQQTGAATEERKAFLTSMWVKDQERARAAMDVGDA